MASCSEPSPVTRLGLNRGLGRARGAAGLGVSGPHGQALGRASGQLLGTLTGHGGWVRSVAWDARGERLASGSGDHTVKLWDAGSETLLWTLRGHEDWIRSVAWDTRGDQLASGSSDQTVRLWDATSGQLLRTLPGHDAGVMSIAWDPHGERLAVGCADGSLWIWDVAADPPRPLVRLYAGPDGGVWRSRPMASWLLATLGPWIWYASPTAGPFTMPAMSRAGSSASSRSPNTCAAPRHHAGSARIRLRAGKRGTGMPGKVTLAAFPSGKVMLSAFHRD
ncbi:MAG: WD40 repeat domain-containing protein [Gammaproteobacteria bacterium]|nr:WD40 repeat domain-containing protein [Gammaproteobacteria bacterium]